MKPPTLLSLVLFSLVNLTIAHADWVLEYRTETGDGVVKSVVKAKGDMVSMASEDGNGVLKIMDSKTGDTLLLFSENKEVLKRRGADIAAKQKQTDEARPGIFTKPVDTGEKGKFEGFDCDIYLRKIGTTPQKFWVARNYPNGEKIVEVQNRKRLNQPGAKDMALVIKGVIVKEVIEAPEGKQPTTTLVSAREVELREEEFKAPRDYQEMGSLQPR